jgi:hypothetical protein
MASLSSIFSYEFLAISKNVNDLFSCNLKDYSKIFESIIDWLFEFNKKIDEGCS